MRLEKIPDCWLGHLDVFTQKAIEVPVIEHFHHTLDSVSPIITITKVSKIVLLY